MLQRFDDTAPTPQRISKIKAVLIKKALAVAPPKKPVVVAKLEAPTLKDTSAAVIAETVATTDPEAKDKDKEASTDLPAPIQVATILDDDELDEEEDSNEEEITAASILSRQLFHSKLVRWTFQHVKYPKRAIKRNQEGRVLLEVTINRKGQVINEAILQPAKFSTLNNAAKKAIGRASPFPVIPAEITDQQFVFSLPITFRLPK